MDALREVGEGAEYWRERLLGGRRGANCWRRREDADDECCMASWVGEGRAMVVVREKEDVQGKMSSVLIKYIFSQTDSRRRPTVESRARSISAAHRLPQCFPCPGNSVLISVRVLNAGIESLRRSSRWMRVQVRQAQASISRNTSNSANSPTCHGDKQAAGRATRSMPVRHKCLLVRRCNNLLVFSYRSSCAQVGTFIPFSTNHHTCFSRSLPPIYCLLGLRSNAISITMILK